MPSSSHECYLYIFIVLIENSCMYIYCIFLIYFIWPLCAILATYHFGLHIYTQRQHSNVFILIFTTQSDTTTGDIWSWQADPGYFSLLFLLFFKEIRISFRSQTIKNSFVFSKIIYVFAVFTRFALSFIFHVLITLFVFSIFIYIQIFFYSVWLLDTT